MYQAPSILLFQSLWMTKKATDCFPNRFIHQIGAQLLVPAEPDPTETVSIRPDAVVVSVRTQVVFTSTWTDGLAVVSIPATGTDNQALNTYKHFGYS